MTRLFLSSLMRIHMSEFYYYFYVTRTAAVSDSMLDSESLMEKE